MLGKKKRGHLTKKVNDLSTGRSDHETDHMVSFQGDTAAAAASGQPMMEMSLSAAMAKPIG